MPKGVYKHKSPTEETKRKMSASQKGTKLGKNNPMYGKKQSKETIEKRKKRKEGFIPWHKEKIEKMCLVCNKTFIVSPSAKLSKFCSHQCFGISQRGNVCHLWRGGITELSDTIRNHSVNKLWRRKVFERDNYTCQKCNKRDGSELHAHHIKPYSILLSDFLQEYSQFSPMEDKETLIRLSETYKPFLDTSNGITLCIECHKLTGNYLNCKGGKNG